MPPIHEDPELGQPTTHAHFDYRFCSNRQLQQVRVYAEATLGQPFSDSDLVRFISFVPQNLPNDESLNFFEVRWLRRKCYRLFPDYDLPLFSVPQQTFLQQFVGQALDCGRCPHRGIFVLNHPRLPHHPDRVVCRGHGLTIDVARQVVIDSPAQQNSAHRFLDILNLTILATSAIPSADSLEAFWTDLSWEFDLSDESEFFEVDEDFPD